MVHVDRLKASNVRTHSLRNTTMSGGCSSPVWLSRSIRRCSSNGQTGEKSKTMHFLYRKDRRTRSRQSTAADMMLLSADFSDPRQLLPLGAFDKLSPTRPRLARKVPVSSRRRYEMPTPRAQTHGARNNSVFGLYCHAKCRQRRLQLRKGSQSAKSPSAKHVRSAFPVLGLYESSFGICDMCELGVSATEYLTNQMSTDKYNYRRHTPPTQVAVPQPTP
jgi:hypothetical protein